MMQNWSYNLLLGQIGDRKIFRVSSWVQRESSLCPRKLSLQSCNQGIMYLQNELSIERFCQMKAF